MFPKHDTLVSSSTVHLHGDEFLTSLTSRTKT